MANDLDNIIKGSLSLLGEKRLFLDERFTSLDIKDSPLAKYPFMKSYYQRRPGVMIYTASVKDVIPAEDRSRFVEKISDAIKESVLSPYYQEADIDNDTVILCTWGEKCDRTGRRLYVHGLFMHVLEKETERQLLLSRLGRCNFSETMPLAFGRSLCKGTTWFSRVDEIPERFETVKGWLDETIRELPKALSRSSNDHVVDLLEGVSNNRRAYRTRQTIVELPHFFTDEVFEHLPFS